MAELNVFNGAPRLPDFRQSGLRQALGSDKMAEVMADMDCVGVINTRGWPASAVNLGWLQDRIKVYWAERPELEPDEFACQVRDELCSVVSRLKRVVVDVCWADGTLVVDDPDREKGRQCLRIKLVTKDDHGWYDYGFRARLGRS